MSRHQKQATDKANKTTAPPVLDNDDSQFLNRLGQSVRQARRRIGLTRRALAQNSDTSERYLAQIESGTGNASVLVLRRIAEATSTPVNQFLNEQPMTQELLELVTRLQAQPEEHTREFLSNAQQWFSDTAQDRKAQRFAVIGLRGAGKSTLARSSARRLGLPFVELTQEIEHECGLETKEVFSLYGDNGYRELESHCLRQVSRDYPSVVLAVAGGITTREETYEHLLENFHSIWLKATPDEYMQRVIDQGDKRPVAGIPQAMSALKSLLQAREPDYARAAHAIDTSGRGIEACVDDLTRLVSTLLDDSRAATGSEPEEGQTEKIS